MKAKISVAYTHLANGGNEHSTSQYVSDDDYLVRTDEGWYMLVDKDDFEREFERVLD